MQASKRFILSLPSLFYEVECLLITITHPDLRSSALISNTREVSCNQHKYSVGKSQSVLHSLFLSTDNVGATETILATINASL